jgi:anti-sigma factor ChrR (cupin superfamily)
MTEHLSAEELQGYIARNLGAEALAVAAEHLAACPACRDRAASLTPPSHLTKDQFVAYAEGRLKDLPARIHILECTACRVEATDLRQAADLQKAPSPKISRFWMTLTLAACLVLITLLLVLRRT